MQFTIRRGLDLPIPGAPAPAIEDAPRPRSVALVGADHPALRPALEVELGQRVRIGDPLFTDRRRPRIRFTSPGAGVVSGIHRGARRRLQSVVVDLDPEDTEEEAREFERWPAEALATLSREAAVDQLLESGLWTAFRARPFATVPRADDVPHSIFVTATDTRPLALAPGPIVEAHREEFTNGLTVLSHLTEGTLWVCRAPGVTLPAGAAGRAVEAEFAGPHPSGLPGTHIHFLDPVGPDRQVWYVGYQDVIAIGSLFTTGRPRVERVVSLAGPPVRRPRLLRTRLGARIADLVEGEVELREEARVRRISGSVLAGRTARGAEGFLGRYHLQISCVEEPRDADALPAPEWARDRYSAVRRGPWARRMPRFTTSRNGARAPHLPIDAYERVMPLDILPTPLLRALLVEDVEAAVDLGCLELAEEDVALLSYVCPSKRDYGRLLRNVLADVQRESL